MITVVKPKKAFVRRVGGLALSPRSPAFAMSAKLLILMLLIAVTSHAQSQNNQQSASDIDNCCFINRHCQTDQEWVDGYWAYQGNECPAHSQVNQQSPTAIDNQQSASDIDNCCFIDRHCQTDQDWTDGYWAYQRNECAASAPARAGNTHGIAIQGSPAFATFVTDALDDLQAISPKWHNYIVSATDQIIETEGLGSTGAADTARRVIMLAPYSIWHREFVTNPIALVQEVSVHEACHIHRHEAGIPYVRSPEYGFDPLEEWACNQVQCEMGSELRGSFCPIETIEEWLDWLKRYGHL